MFKNHLLFIFLILLCYSCSPKPEVSSPDGKIKLSFILEEEGRPAYQVTVDDKPFLLPSSLGFQAQENINLEKGFKIRNTTFNQADEIWTQPWGENKTIRNHYNEMAVLLENTENTELILRFKVFNDGLGFRYECKVSGTDSVFIQDELTSFNIANDGKSWSIPADFNSYEHLYRTMQLSELKAANTPMTFKTDTPIIYASIHEAALTDFPEMTLQKVTAQEFKANLAPWPDGTKAKLGNTFKIPWRTMQIGEKAVDLINSPLILNLNEPCVLESTDWVRPMKYVGIWWGMHLGVETWKMDDRHGATTANAKKYIDFAHNNNIEAVLFEGWNEGWESWGGMQNFDYTKPYADFDIAEIARYAQEKGIEIIGHHETGGNVPNYERQLENSIKWYADLGIHNLKTGYAGGIPNGHLHHNQYMVRHYRKVVETAARYHTTVNAHEPIKETGIRRTYPNMMTREGVRGMEWNAWSEGNPPSHHEILPFTRMLAGPLDYTPGTFDILFANTKHSPRRKAWNDLDKGNSRVHTTLAKQMANWVILYSPMQMASDVIENYEGHPAFQFFRDFDADCDESIALAGEPGEFVVIVRKAKDKYFLGASTNEESRDVNLSLDFLENGKNYKAVIYADGAKADWETNPTDYQIIEKDVTSIDSLTIHMAKGGGQAISFMPY